MVDFEEVKNKILEFILKKWAAKFFVVEIAFSFAFTKNDKNDFTRHLFIYEAILENNSSKCLFWWVLRTYLTKIAFWHKIGLSARSRHKAMCNPYAYYVSIGGFYIKM